MRNHGRGKSSRCPSVSPYVDSDPRPPIPSPTSRRMRRRWKQLTNPIARRNLCRGSGRCIALGNYFKGSKVLQIRQAETCDIRDLVDLDDECFDTYYYQKTKFGNAEFQNYLSGKKSILLVAVRDSGVVGYVAGAVRTSRRRSIAHLDSIAVASTARQKGIGSQLLRLFTQEAKRRACNLIMLEVATDNKEGLRFFSKRGFLKIHDLPGYYGSDLNGVLMGLGI